MAEPRGLKERHFQTPGGWAESDPGTESLAHHGQDGRPQEAEAQAEAQDQAD